MKKITVIGCGRWGSFLAWYNNYIGNKVNLWGRSDSKSFLTLKQNKQNEYVKLDDNINLMDNLDDAINDCEIVIISISSQKLRDFFESVDMSIFEGKKIVLCMKGIEVSTGKRLTEVAIECGVDKSNLAVWLGPGHIQEFVKGVPNCMTIDSYNPKLTKELVDIFQSPLIRFYYGADIIGNELGGATKNIIGIAAGLLDGYGYTSLKGPLMARGVREVARLIKVMGGDPMTAYSLTHLGDYETTLFSPHSNNRNYGEAFAKKQPFPKLAEGVMTTRAVVDIAKKYDVDMPITLALYNILFNNATPMQEMEKLFARNIKGEFDD